MGKRKKTTIGFSYYMGLHMGLCRGPINQISMIKIGGRVAYDSGLQIDIGTDGIWPPTIAPEIPNYSENQVIDIVKPELFGGTKAEGGVNGKLWLLNGWGNQVAPDELKNMLGSPEEQPDFRGVTTVYFDGMICQMNPYPKPWRFLVRRTTEGWDGPTWYPEKCSIIHQKPYDPDNPYELAYRSVMAMNGAHIIYECMTNRQWGRGLQASRLDVAAFRQAADTLYDEQLGLCLRWNRTDTIENFVQLVLDHIGGVTRLDKVTGLYTLKLLRHDYDPDDLPTYTTDNGILEITEASSGATADTINEVIVNYFDPILDIEAQVKVQNIAAIQTAGSIATSKVDYMGCPTDELAMRLAQRDLRAGTTNLRRFRIVADRRLWRVQPGDVIKIADPARNIGQIVLRVGTVEDGTLTNGKITIVAVQDVFSYQLSPFGGVQPPLGTVPDFRPTAKRTLIYEKPYVELNTEYPPAEFQALPNSAGIFNYHMERPNGLSMGYDMAVKPTPTSDFVVDGSNTGEFTPLAALAVSLDYLDTQLTYSAEDNVNMEQVEPGMSALIGEEFIRVDAIDLEARTVTISRGVMDTRPHRHFVGDLVWFTGDTGGTDYVNYAPSQEVAVRGMPWNMRGGRLPLEDAPEEQVSMDWRFYRPYLPGRCEAKSLTTPRSPWFNIVELRHDVGGYYIEDPECPEGDTCPPIYIEVPDVMQVYWTHRDRVLQADVLVPHEDEDIGPEPTTTYKWLVRNAQGDIVRTETGVVGTTFSYPYGQAASDLNVEGGEDDPVVGFVDLCAVRSGLDSWQFYRIPIRVYKRPPQQMFMAQSAEQVVLRTDLDTISGVQISQVAGKVAVKTDDQPTDGVQAVAVTEQVQHRATYPVNMDNRAFEAPYLIALRENRDPAPSYLKVAVARPSDRVADHHNLVSGVSGTATVGGNQSGLLTITGINPQTPVYQDHGAQVWSPWAVISADNTNGQVSPLADEILIGVTSESDGVPALSLPVGSLILVDNEWMEVTGMMPDRIKVRRGTLDTIPAIHRAGRPIWLCGDLNSYSNTEYGNWDEVSYKLRAESRAWPAPESILPKYTLQMMNRPNRPYPPGLVLVDGKHWFEGGDATGDTWRTGRDVVFTWAHRSRLWQSDSVYDHFDVGVPYENGVTYVLEIWGASCRQVDGGFERNSPVLLWSTETDGTSAILPAAEAERVGYALQNMAASCTSGTVCGSSGGTVTLYAKKDQLASWQAYSIALRMPGYRACPTEDGDSPGGGSGGGSGGSGGGSGGSGGGSGGSGGSGNPGNPNPTDPDNPNPTDPDYPDPPPTDPDNPNVPDTGEPPPPPPPVIPDEGTGWGDAWDHKWAGPSATGGND